MDSEISQIIAKILGGEASLEDKHTLIKWLGQDPENMNVMRQSESIWHALGIISSKDLYNSKEAFEHFKTAAMQKQREEKSGLRRSLDIVLRIAAIIVLITGLALWLFQSRRNKPTAAGSLCEVIAPAGSKAQVVLPDGTKVWLNADSKINYRPNFGATTREVYLEGEGYFEVTKDPKKPFVVNTSDIRVKALGTSFNVKSYPADKTIVTTLIEGKVVLEQNATGKTRDKTITMVPNQQAVIYKHGAIKPEQKPGDMLQNTGKSLKYSANAESGFVLNDKVNTEISTAWKNNYLYFEDETFRDIAIKLERRFNITIQFNDDKIAQIRFVGKFQDVIIEQVLAALQYASPFEYVVRDKNIIIYNSSQRIPK